MMMNEVMDRIDEAYLDYRGREDRLHSAVGEARQLGATWTQIGNALGVSPQAAQQRFGRS